MLHDPKPPQAGEDVWTDLVTVVAPRYGLSGVALTRPLTRLTL